MTDPATTLGPPMDTPPGTVPMDAAGRIRRSRGGANTAALLRIGLGFLYLWAFLSHLH